MIWFLLLICAAPILFAMPVDSELRWTSLWLHKKCTDLYVGSELASALVCGERLDGIWRNTLVSLGLLHVAVISGLQVQTLTGICRRFGRQLGRYGEFVSMTLTCTLLLFGSLGSPPVFRALGQFLISQTNSKFNWFWSNADIALISGMMTIQWCLWTRQPLLSAELSLLAGQIMALQIGHHSRGAEIHSLLGSLLRSLATSILIYLFASPLLITLGIPSPISILSNFLLAPLFGLPLYGLALLRGPFALCAFDTVVTGIDNIFQLVLNSLRALPQPKVLPQAQMETWYGEVYTATLSSILWMISKFARGLPILLFCTAAKANSLIIWNVGQGQWVTKITAEHCLHFDAGGESAPLQSIKSICGQRENLVVISHHDYDHYSYTNWIESNLGEGCSLSEKRLFKKYPECVLAAPYRSFDISKRLSKKSSDNDRSLIAMTDDILIPGDSPRKSEKIWSRLYRREINQIKTLILGHHGSRNSTGPELLNRLPHLRQAISSARFARYRHPSPVTLLRLKERGVAVLRTEDWGSIEIEL